MCSNIKYKQHIENGMIKLKKTQRTIFIPDQVILNMTRASHQVLRGVKVSVHQLLPPPA